jgi:DNA primase
MNLNRLKKSAPSSLCSGNFSQKHTWESLSGEVEINQSLADILFPTKKEEEHHISLPKELISLANNNLPYSASEPMKYLRERGLEKEDIIRWKIGYCKDGEYKNRVIIPSFNKDGYCNYFVARSYAGQRPNYINPAVSKDIIFNELFIDFKSDLILVEGVFDAIKAGNAVPILGSTLREDSKLFQEITKHDTPIYIALDPDAERKTKVEIALIHIKKEKSRMDNIFENLEKEFVNIYTQL